MGPRPISRRTLLAAGAGTLAGRLAAGPSALALAALRPPSPRVREQGLGGLSPGLARTVTLAHNADLVGLQWRGPAAPALEVRFARPHTRGAARGTRAGTAGAGAYGPWMSADGRGHGPDGAGAAGEPVGEPLWTGGTRAVQVRSRSALAALRLHTVDVSFGIGAAALARTPAAALLAATPPLAGSPLAAGPGVPAIVARRAWARGVARPRYNPAYGEVRLAFVHHSENPNGYTRAEVAPMLLAIHAFHRYVRGWNDIGYNFVVDRFGRIFEGRAGGIEEPVIGAQAGGYNAWSTGVAVLGTYGSAPLSGPARDALERLLAWKLSLHGAPVTGRTAVRVTRGGAVYSRFPAGALVTLRRVCGHRDGDSTDCPGAALYALLPDIRAGTRARTPPPTSLTLVLAAPGAVPAPPPPGAPPAVLIGTLAVLGGAPVVGAQVLIQARRVSARGQVVAELTLTGAVTDVQGRYAATVPAAAVPRTGLALRAVYAGAPGTAARAAVSAPLVVLPGTLRPRTAPAPTPSAPPPPAA